MDDDFAESSNTQEHVYDRDGKLCWLCNHKTSVHIAHHIDAAASSSFSGSMTMELYPPRLPTHLIMTTLFHSVPTVTQLMMLHFLNGSLSLTRRPYRNISITRKWTTNSAVRHRLLHLALFRFLIEEKYYIIPL